MSATLMYCGDAALQADHLAKEVAKRLRELIGRQGEARLAVSGGRSPIGFFQVLSAQQLPWECVNISLVDERMVEPTHVDSNYRLLREYLLQNHAKSANLQPLFINPQHLSDINHQKSPAELANARYQAADIVVLGMGADGHTASLFPQLADLNATDNIIDVHPKTAAHSRLSMSLNAILQAQYLYLAIGGDEKMAVFDEAQKAKNAQLPISYVIAGAKHLEVYYYD